MRKNKAIRHGEVLLHPVGKLPDGLSKSFKSFIVGHSETGHHHVLEAMDEFEVVELSDELFLRLFQPAKLVHKKSMDAHKTLPVAPGIYHVKRKTEYDPWAETIRGVFD